MRLLRLFMLAIGLILVVLGVSYFTSLFAQQGVPEDPRLAAISAEDIEPVPEDSIEIQTSGPIHEAFAIPLTTDLPESIVVKQKPPEPIEELPPTQRPDGSNVVWIPGYFGWDEQRNDFLWISGFWRDVPPGRVWVSGYWTEAAEGYQWVPGFWTSAEQNQVTYLPQPPEMIERGPTIEQPSPDHFWVPGHWSWVSDHYAWRTGYWSRIHPDWVWIPAHYIWCPSGYIFVDGYWDYPVVRRGMLFAPAYFNPVVYHRRYYYTPSIVWSAHLLTRHLWVRPAYYHYYFGDYYDDRFVDFGYRPWYLSFTFGRVSYDPLFSYYRWYHRGDRDWVRDVRERHDYYRRNRDHRPPRTYRELERIVSRAENRNVIRDTVVAAPITQIVNNTTVNNVNANVIDANFRTPFQFERVAQQERRQIARQADEIRSVVRERRKIETRENVARVEAGRREGARKGEDERIRRPAQRGLDISNLAQTIGTTPGSRDVDSRRRRDDAVRGPADRASDLRRAIAGQDTGVSKTPDAQQPGRGRTKERVGSEFGATSQGPDLGRRGGRSDFDRPDRAPDIASGRRGGDIKQPDLALEINRPNRERDRRGRDSNPGIQPGSTRAIDSNPILSPPDRSSPESKGTRRGIRETRPATSGLPGARTAEPPIRGRGPALDAAPERERPSVDRGRGARIREQRIPPPTFSSEPANVMRIPPGLDRPPAARSGIERPTTRSFPRELGFSGGASGRQPPPAEAQGRTDRVAPLRFGAPQPGARSVAPPQVRSRPQASKARESRSPPVRDRGRDSDRGDRD
jgi:hypothetical protein